MGIDHLRVPSAEGTRGRSVRILDWWFVMQKRITWVCSQCGGSVTDGCTVDNEENLVCYQCCAVQDHEYMLENPDEFYLPVI